MFATRLKCVLAVVLVVGLAALSAADPSSGEVARLIEQLGDDHFNVREAAAARLKKIGEPALPALSKALASNDAEVRRRAEEIVAVIEHKLYGAELSLIGHTSEVRCVSVSADGQRLLTSSFDGTLRLWDTDTGKCLRVFEGHSQRICGAVLSMDGKRVLSGSGDRTVRLWDAVTGKELHRMAGHTEEVLGVCFGPEGQALSSGADGAVRLWDLETGKQAGIFSGHTNWVHTVVYSGKAKGAATCSGDESIRLWDLESGKEVRALHGQSGHNNVVVCFSPDGQLLLSAGLDLTLRILDVKTGKEQMRIEDAHAYSAVFSPDGKRIAAGCVDKTVCVWDAATGKVLRKYEGHTGAVVGVTFFPDGKRIASASQDHTARIWRAPR